MSRRYPRILAVALFAVLVVPEHRARKHHGIASGR